MRATSAAEGGAATASRPTGFVEIDDVGRVLREAFASRQAVEERFRLAQDIGGIGAWDWNVLRDQGHVTETYKQMHGLDAVEDPLKMEHVLGVVHPDDLKDYLARLAAARGRPEPSTNEYRVVRPDGSVRWIAPRVARSSTRMADILALWA